VCEGVLFRPHRQWQDPDHQSKMGVFVECRPCQAQSTRTEHAVLMVMVMMMPEGVVVRPWLTHCWPAAPRSSHLMSSSSALLYMA
jgi:hypothetical protein